MSDCKTVFVMGGAGGDSVPPGTYQCEFMGTDSAPPHPEYGPGVKWRFKVVEGPHAGSTLSRITQSSPTSKNACGKMLVDLLGGKPIAEGKQIDIADYVGKKYLVIARAGENGKGTRVETVSPLG